MTTTVRNGDTWDYNKHAFKDHDPFCEPGLISILCLTSGKPVITAKCFDATIEATKDYAGEIEWIFLDQSDKGEDRGQNGFTLARYNHTLERSVVVLPKRNYGINNALNQMFALSRGEFCMIHENDWMNIKPGFNFLQKAMDVMRAFEDISIIQLRDSHDPCENWGFGKIEFNPWSCIGGYETRHLDGEALLVKEFENGYNHNPIIIRKSLWRTVAPLSEPPFGTDPRHDETHMQRKIGKQTVAYIGGVYQHIGGSRRGEFER